MGEAVIARQSNQVESCLLSGSELGIRVVAFGPEVTSFCHDGYGSPQLPAAVIIKAPERLSPVERSLQERPPSTGSL